MKAPQYAYIGGKVVPLEEAKVSVLTHAFNYGTGIFEGIRGYYSAENHQLYIFRLRDHFERMEQNCKLLKIRLPHSIDDLCRLTVRLAEMNQLRENIYIRPLAYKSAQRIGVRMNEENDFTLFMVPFGDYLSTDRALRVCVSSWRRLQDNAIPARGKICGAYVNSALAVAEAQDNGFDEAILLNEDGHVAEGSAMNLILVKRGHLVVPPKSDNILDGITRDTLTQIARQELEVETEVRSIDRTELYSADELFLCGTGVQIAPVGFVDHRRIGQGTSGPITRQLMRIYDEILHGRLGKYSYWLTHVY
ncbi:MAG: branched-chain amino acid transaminase [Acidobacteria bacterium]|nr:branched-chain amino acid transaminase [Acidobacteriota bacterium]